MAALQELKDRLLLLESTNIGRQQQRVAGFEAAAREARAAANSSNFTLPDQIEAFKAARARATAAEQDLQVAQADLSSLELEAQNLRNEIAAAERADANVARQSTGQTTAEQQQANAEGADPQSPNPPPQSAGPDGVVAPASSTVSTNAALEPTGGSGNRDAGTNDPTRTANNTQATPASVATPGGINSSTPSTLSSDAEIASGATAGGVVPTQNGGVSAAGDDQFNAVKTQINTYFGGPGNIITPKPNVLDRFASYTYNVSLYIMSPTEYKKLLTTKQKNISGFQLLMQSGGAPNAGGTLRPVDAQESQQAADGNSDVIAQPTLGRNQYFPLDYYMDDIRLKGAASGKATGGAHNVFEMSFKIIEPNGITLLDNLYAATQQYAKLQGTDEKQNYAAQMYLMVIRFYGYDADGNFINIKGQITNPDGSVGPEAVVEKYIPFVFSGIKFRIANKLTEYECEAVCPQNLINTGQGRGTIPYNIEITSTTLKELLTGKLTLKSANQTSDTGRGTPASTVPAVAAKTTNPGNQLPAVGTNTEFENSLGTQNYAETGPGYLGIVNDPTVVVAGNSPTQSSAPPKASAAPQPTMFTGLCDALNTYQAEQVAAGKQRYADVYEIYLVDQVLQDARLQPQPVEGSYTNWNSTAMIPQKTAAEQKDGKKQSAKSNTKNADIVAGTSIVRFIDQAVRTSSYIYDQQIMIPTVNPKTGKQTDVPNGGAADVLAWYRIGTEAEPIAYDPKRNDYAYKIKYQVSLYQVNGVKSDYFPPSKFTGVHKKYNYWFTGENNSIINLEQDYNYLYYITVNGSQMRPRNKTTDYREMEKYLVQTRSNQSDQGQPGMVNEPSANAADYLYSPGDQSHIKLTIVGDPAWLQQGELIFGLSGKSLYQSPFLSDGTINFERQEVLFEVAFNKAVDYNLETGLMDPGQKNYEANRTAGEAGSARQSYIYKATEITSIFSRGRFTQELEGALVMFDIKPKTSVDATITPGGFDSFRSGEEEDAAAAGTTTRTSATSTATGSASQTGLVGFNPTPLATGLNTQATASTSINPVPTLVPQAPPALPFSAGQTVGPPAGASVTTNYATGGVTQQSVTAQMVLKSGRAVTVTSEAEVNQLYSQGLVTSQNAGAAIYALGSKTAAQQATTTNSAPQLTDRET